MPRNMKNIKSRVESAEKVGKIEKGVAKELKGALDKMNKSLDAPRFAYSDGQASRDLNKISNYVKGNAGSGIDHSVASELASRLDSWSEDYKKTASD